MTCKKCGSAMIGDTCPPCTVRELERTDRELVDEFGSDDGRPLVGAHPLDAGGTFSNVLGGHEVPHANYFESRTAWFLYDQEPLRPRRRAVVLGANGKPVIDISVPEDDAAAAGRSLSRRR